MAVKKFHITPNRPKRCTATFRPCPFSEHYGSEESALAADRINQRNNAHLAELKTLHDNHRNPDPQYFSRSSFTFRDNSESPRQFGQEIDARTKHFGVKPQIFHSMGQFRLKNGNGTEVNMQVMRMTEVDEGFARYNGVWRFVNKSNKLGQHRSAETNSDIVLDFSTEQAARRSMLQAREMFRNAVIWSGIYKEEEADLRADKMAEDFKNMFNAVESDAAGDFDVWERGMGYFTESDGQTIVVNEDYRTSAFRAENFKNFLAENPYYRSRQPDVDIRVTDRHGNTGASWTIKKENGQWAVDKRYPDGYEETLPVSSPQEALDHVYYHTLTEINPDNETEALAKGRYAAELFSGVEAALAENSIALHERWDEEDARREEKANAKINHDMYDLEKEPKGSMMGKIFESFT